MKKLFAVAFALSVGCASTMSSSARPAQASAQAGSCTQVTAASGAVVYSGPDSTSPAVTTLKDSTQVCADAASVGFGFRHVKLSNGKEGYVAESDLLG